MTSIIQRLLQLADRDALLDHMRRLGQGAQRLFHTLFERFEHRPMALWGTVFVFGLCSGAILGLSTGLQGRSIASVDVEGQGRFRAEPISIVLGKSRDEEMFDLSGSRLNGGDQILPSKDPIALPSISEELFEALSGSDRPKIAIVIDDLGLSREAFEAVNRLPPPVTLSFLPYGMESQSMLNMVSADHEAMLHLPMEPKVRRQDAGPNMLKVEFTEAQIKEKLGYNLSKLYGYNGVNNHTGSLFTSNSRAMKTVLAELDARGLFFLDSLTSGSSKAREVADANGWTILERDVFLDADKPAVTVETVKRRLRDVEAIAREKGSAIAIAHPYDVTLETLGPWLVTAEMRGFDLVRISELLPQRREVLLASLNNSVAAIGANSGSPGGFAQSSRLR